MLSTTNRELQVRARAGLWRKDGSPLRAAESTLWFVIITYDHAEVFNHLSSAKPVRVPPSTVRSISESEIAQRASLPRYLAAWMPCFVLSVIRSFAAHSSSNLLALLGSKFHPLPMQEPNS